MRAAAAAAKWPVSDSFPKFSLCQTLLSLQVESATLIKCYTLLGQCLSVMQDGNFDRLLQAVPTVIAETQVAKLAARPGERPLFHLELILSVPMRQKNSRRKPPCIKPPERLLGIR